ncbi:MAG: hypothetical protein ACE5OZ_13000 [Candidatus Heimdallarchaeota archaeon]
MTTIAELAEQGYRGCSVYSLLRDSQFRNELLASSDSLVRGNLSEKNELLDQLAVSAKALVIGPAGEGKSLFAKTVLEALAAELSGRKFKIAGCPINEDAACLCLLSQLEDAALNNYLRFLGNSLCPSCSSTVEMLLSESAEQDVSLTRTSHILKSFDRSNLISLIQSLKTERVTLQASQIDPRTDPDSIYMLLAGVENLERLLGEKTSTTFDPSAHKLGALGGQGLILINEIHRLPLRLLESLMGFLEESATLRYSISGRMVTIDGGLIFTANSPLFSIGDDMAPIVSRIPMVLWPARNLAERKTIVSDIFQEHLRRKSSPLGYSPLGSTFSKPDSFFLVSRLAVELVARVASLSFPEALFSTNRPQEFLNSLEITQISPKVPFFDTRTLYQFIGKLLLVRGRKGPLDLLTLEDVLPNLSALGFDNEIAKSLHEIKDLVKQLIIATPTNQLTIDAIEAERRALDQRIQEPEEFKKAIILAEGLESDAKKLPESVIERLKESYFRILEEY